MSILRNNLEAVEVCTHFRNMVDHRCNTKQCRVATIVLEMPEEEGEDETNTDTHDPGDQHEHQQADVGEGLEINYTDNDQTKLGYYLKDCGKLRHSSQLAGEHLHALGLFFQFLLFSFIGDL